ncbi:MAG: YHS domain-containing (seleno)protein [Planctomycetota bacterium]
MIPQKHAVLTLAAAAMLASTPAPSLAAAAGTIQAQQPEQSPSAEAEPVRNISEWNLTNRSRPLALRGYDPVAYFPEGGGKAKRGNERISVNYRGVNYNFTSREHRALFTANPSRYEPAYGGWCAWAMSTGGKTEIDPKNYIVKNDRLFVFYKGFFADTRKDWLKGNHSSLANKADGHWRDIAGEEPRRSPVDEG